MEEKKALIMMAALSQETRFRIIHFLVRRGVNGASAGKIAETVRATSSRTSFHLSLLEKSGLVTFERQSRYMIYRADIKKIGRLMSFMLNDCCGDHPDIRACCMNEVECCREE